MKTTTRTIFDTLLREHPALTPLQDALLDAYALLLATYRRGGTLFVCGNGGSAADSEHIVGELMKCFRKPRPIDPALASTLCAMGEDGVLLADTLERALPAVSLTSHLSLSTAYANDRAPDVVFAQQLSGLARAGDTLLCLSTSGNSRNCVLAAMVGRAMGLSVLAMTGERDSRLSALADLTLRAPADETYRVQEYHLPIYHALCAMLEEELF